MKKMIATGLAVLAMSAPVMAEESKCAETNHRMKFMSALATAQLALEGKDSVDELSEAEILRNAKAVQEIITAQEEAQEYFAAVGKKYVLGGFVLSGGLKSPELKWNSRIEINPVGVAVLFSQDSQECGGVEPDFRIVSESGLSIPVGAKESKDNNGSFILKTSEIKLIMVPANGAAKNVQAEGLSGTYVNPISYRRETNKENVYKQVSVSFRVDNLSPTGLGLDGFADDFMNTFTNPIAIVSYNTIKGQMTNYRSLPIGFRYVSFYTPSEALETANSISKFFKEKTATEAEAQ